MESSSCRRGFRRELQGSEAADQVAASRPDAHRLASKYFSCAEHLEVEKNGDAPTYGRTNEQRKVMLLSL